MRALLRSAAGLAFALTAFLISDSPVFAAGGAPSTPPGSYDWSGFYVGGHVGGGWQNTTFTDPGLFSILNNCCEGVNFTNEPGAAASTTGSSFLGGGQAGWMYQFEHFVVGGDADFSATDIQQNGIRSFPLLGPAFVNETYNAHTDWTATSTVTFGYATGPWLLYGKAGSALEHETFGLGLNGSYGLSPFSFSSSSSSKLISGWTAGAGVKWAILDNVFLFAEYDFLDFGPNAEHMSGMLTGALPAMLGGHNTAATFDPIFNQTISEVKVGLNYKFGPGGPVPTFALPQWAGGPTDYDWSGPYVGAHLGGGFQNIGFSDPSAMSVLTNCCFNLGFQGDPGAASDGHGAGFLGGGQAGWAYQLGHLVVGGDADFSATSLSSGGSNSWPGLNAGPAAASATETYNVHTNWTATSTATLGVAGGPWLFYGKAGAAWADDSFGLNVSGFGASFGGPGVPFSFNSSTSAVVLGWTSGVGIKWALSSNLFLDAEYDYLDFGSQVQHIGGNLKAIAGPGFGTISSAANFDPIIRQNISEFKVGLNYKFGSGGPLDSIVPPADAAANYDWSGSYVGAHVGGGYQSTRFSDSGAYSTLVNCCVLIGDVNEPTAGSDANGLGVLGGAQAGLMYQIDRLVVGGDVDFSGSTMKGNGASTASAIAATPASTVQYTEAYNVQTNWISTSTATLGYAAGKWLFYGKAGAAYADDSYSLNVTGVGSQIGPPRVPFSYSSSIERLNIGWTTGIGLKWALSDNLFLNAEYDLMDFGSTTHSFNGNFSAAPAAFVAGYSRNATFEPIFNQTVSAVKIGLNYKFQPF